MERLAWWQHPRAFFERYDLLLTPTVACPPFALGLDHPREVAGTPVVPYGWLPYTYPFNLTGQPAASVPWNGMERNSRRAPAISTAWRW